MKTPVGLQWLTSLVLLLLNDRLRFCKEMLFSHLLVCSQSVVLCSPSTLVQINIFFIVIIYKHGSLESAGWGRGEKLSYLICSCSRKTSNCVISSNQI